MTELRATNDSTDLTTETYQVKYATPIVVNLGAQKRKRVKKLKKGQGPLVGEIHEAIQSVLQQLGDDRPSHDYVPIVVLYREKRKKSKLPNLLFPFM
jgi:hypothetical protein